MTHLLGGRVRHDQPPDGHRSGIEPVLLAAAVPAEPGDTVLEGGTGSGTALLCLAARVVGLSGVGLELDPQRAAQAMLNFSHNHFTGLRAEIADLTAWRTVSAFDHAMANPPFHADGTASPDPARERARRGSPGLLAAWAESLARPLRRHGTLTLVVAAAALTETATALRSAGCGSLALLPLWPREGRPAKLVLLQGRKAARGPDRVLPGLVLHQADGRFTPQADAVLRDGAALPL